MLSFFFHFYATLDSVTAIKDNPYQCDGVEIVSRKEWQARPSLRESWMATPVNMVIIQHTAGGTCSTKFQCLRKVSGIQNYHMDCRGWNDIAYNFLVGGDGRVYQGLGWNQSGSHSINFNTKSIGMAFMGNFNIDEPTDKMIIAARRLIDCGVLNGFIAPTKSVYGHRDVACQESPGDKLYAIIQQWIDYGGQKIRNWDCSGY